MVPTTVPASVMSPTVEPTAMMTAVISVTAMVTTESMVEASPEVEGRPVIIRFRRHINRIGNINRRRLIHIEVNPVGDSIFRHEDAAGSENICLNIQVGRASGGVRSYYVGV